jgi:hypothetical protein
MGRKCFRHRPSDRFWPERGAKARRISTHPSKVEPIPRVTVMKCEMCGSRAVVHTNTVCVVQDAPPARKQRHLCEACAREGMPRLVPLLAAALVTRLRELVQFIKANNRLPSPGEPVPCGPTDPSGRDRTSGKLRALATTSGLSIGIVVVVNQALSLPTHIRVDEHTRVH